MVESARGELGMDGIGDSLRSERLRAGLTLQQIATQTKIGQYLLQAIEANQFDRLPGGLLTRSFVRQYAQVVGLDAEEVVASYKQQFEEPELAPTELQPKHRFSRLPSLPILLRFVTAISVCAGIYVLWENVRRSLPETHIEPLQSSRVISESDLQLMKSFQALPELAPRQAPASVPSASPRSGSEPGAKDPIRVVFTATEPVWVSIQSDGTPAYTGVLEQQHNKELAAANRMTAVIGNAGGLEVSLNGKAIGPIGQHGEVRLLEMTRTGAHISRPTK
jgi:cytoskeleton protein RodZ